MESIGAFGEVVEGYLTKLRELVLANKLSFADGLHGALPKRCGVYRIVDARGDVDRTMYVGKSGNLLDRIYYNLLMGDAGAHTLRRKVVDRGLCEGDEYVKEFLKSNWEVQYLEMEDRREATFFEHFAIAVLRAELND